MEQFLPWGLFKWVSEWLNLTAFLGTADSGVHIVHISCAIIAYTSLNHCPSVVQIIQNVLFDHSDTNGTQTNREMYHWYSTIFILLQNMCWAMCTKHRAGSGTKRPILIFCITFSTKLCITNFLFTTALASHIILQKNQYSWEIYNVSVECDFFMSTQSHDL